MTELVAVPSAEVVFDSFKIDDSVTTLRAKTIPNSGIGYWLYDRCGATCLDDLFKHISIRAEA